MKSKFAESSAVTHHDLIRLSSPIRDSLSKTPYTPPESTTPVCTKSLLLSLLPNPKPSPGPGPSPSPSTKCSSRQVRDFCLCLAALASVSSEQGAETNVLSWIPQELSVAASMVFEELGKVYFGNVDGKEEGDGSGGDLRKRLVEELMPEAFPLLKDVMNESSVGRDEDEISAASGRGPVGYAVVAACQLRWFLTQVDCPHLGQLCSLVMPCALTALDHWSPQVKGQGMLSFIHLLKNVNADDLSWYEEVILDISCRNISSTDELWYRAVEMSVLSLICFQRTNPRSSWFEKMMNEMLSHLERHPRMKDRRTAWLELIEPVLNSMGLVLLAHFRRIFPLFFQWMHADDDETVNLVLQRAHTIMKLTWIRNTSYTTRLINELAIIYKEAALRRDRDEIRKHVLQILTLLQKCRGEHFEAVWKKHMEDSNLASLASFLCVENTTMFMQAAQ